MDNSLLFPDKCSQAYINSKKRVKRWYIENILIIMLCIIILISGVYRFGLKSFVYMVSLILGITSIYLLCLVVRAMRATDFEITDVGIYLAKYRPIFPRNFKNLLSWDEIDRIEYNTACEDTRPEIRLIQFVAFTIFDNAGNPEDVYTRTVIELEKAKKIINEQCKLHHIPFLQKKHNYDH